MSSSALLSLGTIEQGNRAGRLKGRKHVSVHICYPHLLNDEMTVRYAVSCEWIRSIRAFALLDVENREYRSHNDEERRIDEVSPRANPSSKSEC